MTTSTNRSISTHIRFQLEQLGARNAYHEFEHLCRQFARERIAANVLPATGPVSSGGDQGKDFETFTSFIQPSPARSTRDSRFLLASAESKPLVFACSLIARAKVREKVKSDVTAISASAIPYLIYFFSNQSIPVAWRHELQVWALDEKQCRIEIIDAEALSEQLADPGLFWIAEEYLHVPAELFPSGGGKAELAYVKVRQRWIEEDENPSNFADFVDVKLGLRRSTFNDNLKPDLSRWILKMEAFINAGFNAELVRRASYEVCVAALRGQHNLTPRRGLIERYFTEWGKSTEQSELRDASILLSYASSAVLIGEFEFDCSRLHAWSKSLELAVNEAVSKAPGPNALADLLYTRATVAHLPFLTGTTPKMERKEVFKWWAKTVAAAAKAPLFPIEEFSDLLTMLAEHLGDDPKYREIVDKVDAILERRSKGYLVAEKARDRALALMDGGKTVAAIQELHKAKVKWFTGDTLAGTLLSMMALSDAYLKLGLVWAAKYHSLGVAVISARSDDDDIRRRVVDALGQLAECEYVGGEWVTFSEIFPLLFIAHYQHSPEPDDWSNHEVIKRVHFHFLIARALGTALGGEALATLIEEPFSRLGIPDEIRSDVLSPPLSLERYEEMSPTEIVQRASAAIWGKPFSDCGPERSYSWRAAGITWTATCTNSFVVIPFAEEFIAVLQIAIVDLAHIDLCLLPTSVAIEIILADVSLVRAEQVPDNSQLAFVVKLPQKRGETPQEMQEVQQQILGIAATVLGACSCLQDDKLHKVLKDALKQGLSSKAFLVRPYSELFNDFVDADQFNVRRATAIATSQLFGFELRESDELAWKSGPGPGYSKARANEFITNRYRRIGKAIRTTLARLRASERFQLWVAKMRDEGMRDWQILLLVVNAVLNYKMRSLGLDPITTGSVEFARAFMDSEEAEDAPLIPEDEILDDPIMEMMLATTLSSVANTWSLTIRQGTPDFTALRRLLEARYGQTTDDVPHDDILISNSVLAAH